MKQTNDCKAMGRVADKEATRSATHNLVLKKRESREDPNSFAGQKQFLQISDLQFKDADYKEWR